jgi:tRNA modification GTPase
MTAPLSAMDTFAACLTPPGAAAIATLAVRGPRSWEVARELFRPHGRSHTKLPAQAERGRIWLGRWGVELADEIVLTVTGTEPAPSVEIHCHGGPEVIRMLFDTLQARGIRACSWQEMERLTTANAGRAAAATVLSEARTLRTAAVLLDQYQGAFDRAVEVILAASGRDLSEAVRLLGELARYVPVGRHLTVPWHVVIAGAPNVGKSSLVNALAGFPRCVVAPTPGTTRDLVTTLIAVDGWPVELVDTAGLREGAGVLEAQGIDRARTAAATADLCLWVLDASAPPVWPTAVGSARCVINKMDQPAAWDLNRAAEAVRVSARTGAGLPELCDALAAWLVPEPPPPGVPVPFTPAVCDRVEDAQRCLNAGRPAEARQHLERLYAEHVGFGKN